MTLEKAESDYLGANGHLIGCAMNYVGELTEGTHDMAELEARNDLVKAVEAYNRAEQAYLEARDKTWSCEKIPQVCRAKTCPPCQASGT